MFFGLAFVLSKMEDQGTTASNNFAKITHRGIVGSNYMLDFYSPGDGVVYFQIRQK